jgi:hypothetical protein
MKKLILFTLLAVSTQMFAQEDTKNRVLIQGNQKLSGYGVINTSFSKFNGDFAVLTGAYGGLFINHKLMIGLGGYDLSTKHESPGKNIVTGKANEYHLDYGGLMLEYTFYSDKLIHFTANSLFGLGEIQNGVSEIDNDGHGTHWNNSDDDMVYVIQPSLNVEANITNWFRLGIGGGYRYVTGSEMKGITNKQMSAAQGNVSLKFGGF